MKKSIFCGRLNELAFLQKHWLRAADHAEPEVVVLLADNGLGKTRLVHEFYSWLSTRMASPDGAGYWPMQLDQHGDNLQVNPSLAECSPDHEPPFLWWGLRFHDSEQRNAAVTGMDASIAQLAEHLAMLMAAARNTERGHRALTALADAGVDFALDLTKCVPHISLVKTIANLLQKLWGIGREYHADHSTLSLTEMRQREQASKAERIVETLSKVLAARGDSFPICIFADDTHFSDADPDTVDLLKRLLTAARRDRWPLLLIVAHWQDYWNAEASPVARWLMPEKPRLSVMPFGTMPPKALTPILTQHVPALLPDQAAAILGRADGNPQFLEEIIAFMATNKRLFTSLDLTNSLKPGGLAEVLEVAVGRHKLNTKRFQQLSPNIQAVLAIGSLQGERMSQDLTAEVAETMGLCDSATALQAIRDAEILNNLIHRDSHWAEFLVPV